MGFSELNRALRCASSAYPARAKIVKLVTTGIVANKSRDV